MDCPWGSSDDEASMQIDLDAKQEETTADNSAAITKSIDTYDPSDPTDEYDPAEPTEEVKALEQKKSNVCEDDGDHHDLDYDPADPTLSDDELNITENVMGEDESGTAKNVFGDEPKEISEDVVNDKEEVAEQENECNEKSANKDEASSDEFDNDGRWDSQMTSSQNDAEIFNNSSPEYDNTSTPEKEIEDSGRCDEGLNGVMEDDDGEKDGSGVAAVENVDDGAVPPLDRDENSQMSTLSETNNDDGVGDEGLSDDVPDVTFDDSDFVLEKEPFVESGEQDDRTPVNTPGDLNGECGSKAREGDEENDDGRSKSSHTEGNKWGEEEEDLDEKEREWRRRRQEEVAHLNEEALVDLFREESEPDKEIAEGEMVEQPTAKKTKKKLGTKKLKKKGKKVKGQGKKGQLSSKSQDPEHGDQRFVEISRERPSVESREEGELDGEGGHGQSRRRSYDDRGGAQHRYDYRHDDRSYHHDDNDPREPGEIVESEGKKKGLKKKDKKDKKKKKSKREVATIEEGNQGDEDSQKFPSFLAGFFVQDGMEELEEGQESFVNDFDEEDPRSLFAKASGDSTFRKRQEASDREESARSFERAAEHESDGHYAEESEHWRSSRRHDERWHESREIRHDSRERRHGSREGRYERDHRLDVSNDRDKERERGRSRSERGRDRGRDREREREREKEAERERERNRRIGEERRRGRGSRSRSRERRRRSVSRERGRRSRSRDRSSRRRRHRSRSQDKSAERERDRERERERERSRRRRERSRERESERRRVRRVSHSKSRSPRRRSERASSNKENREELQRRRQRQRARSEEEESEERESGRRYRDQRRRERERSSSPTGSSSDSSSSQSPAHRPQLHHLNFQNYSEDEGNSSDVILVEPERIVINLDEEEDPPSRVDITVGNSDNGNAMGSRSSALIQINPAADEDTRVVEAANDLEESGDATPTRDEASDKAHETQSSDAVKESDYDPAHPTEEDNEDSSEQEKETTEQGSKSPVTVTAAGAAPSKSNEVDDAAPLTEKGPVPPDHPPPEEIRPSPPPIPAETESSVPPLRQQLHPAQQQQRLGQSTLAGNLLNPVMRLINPLLLQQQQKQMSLGPQPGGGLLPLPNTPRMPFMMNQNRGDSEGGPPPGFPQEQQRHIRPLLQIPDRRPPGFGPGGPDTSSLLHHPFGPMGQQQPPPNTNNMLPNMHPRMPISAMPPLAQLTSLLPALEKAKMAQQQQQQDGHLGPGLGPMFGKHHQPSLLGKPPPLSVNSTSNNIPLHNNMPFRPTRLDFSESTEVVDMDMSPGENDCELELPSPNSDSSKEGRTRKRSSRTGGSRNLAAAAAGKGVVQPIAYLKALSKALEKLDPKGHSQSGGGQNAQEKGKSGSSSKKHRNKLDLNDDDVPASAVDLTNKEKYMRKLHLQERVIDEVKLAIKPFYSSKKITKDQYKLILRKAVPKVCHCKGGNINPQKIQELVEAYVKKMGKKQGGGHGGSGKKKSKGASKEGAHNAKEGASGGAAAGGVKQNGERAKKAVSGR